MGWDYFSALFLVNPTYSYLLTLSKILAFDITK